MHEITSQTEADLQGNVERVKAWVEQWKVRVCFGIVGLLPPILLYVVILRAPSLPPSLPLLLVLLPFFLLTPPFPSFHLFPPPSQADCEARVKELSEMEE